MILTRQTCSQRSSMSAGSKRQGLAIYFCVRIYHMFLIWKSRRQLDLGLCITSVLANRMPPSIGKFRQFLRPNMLLNRKSPPRSGFLFASTEVVHRPRSNSLVHFDMRNIQQIWIEKALSVCFPQQPCNHARALPCRIKITCTLLRTNRFASVKMNSINMLQTGIYRESAIEWRDSGFKKLWTCSLQVFEEMVVNRIWTALSARRPLNDARGMRLRHIFLECSDDVIARQRRCLRDFWSFFYLISDLLKKGGHMTFVWWRIYLRLCNMGCVWINMSFSEHQKKKSFESRDIKKFASHTSWQIFWYPSPHSKMNYKNLCVCERETTEEKWERNRENECVREKSRRARERQRERECVGVHTIIPHVHVRVTIFAPEGTVIIYCAAGNFCLMQCQSRQNAPHIQSWLWVTPPWPSPPIHIGMMWKMFINNRKS